MYDFINAPFPQGFLAGLLVGILLAGWTWASAWMKRREMRKELGARLSAVHSEMDTLRQHLHTQMQITAKGTEDQQKQLAELRAQNENLRILVQGLQQKPERAHIRTLEVWQRALERMGSRAPGFQPAWQQALGEAENEVSEAESGLTKFVRKFLGSGKSPIQPGASSSELPAGESFGKDGQNAV